MTCGDGILWTQMRSVYLRSMSPKLTPELVLNRNLWSRWKLCMAWLCRMLQGLNSHEEYIQRNFFDILWTWTARTVPSRTALDKSLRRQGLDTRVMVKDSLHERDFGWFWLFLEWTSRLQWSPTHHNCNMFSLYTTEHLTVSDSLLVCSFFVARPLRPCSMSIYDSQCTGSWLCARYVQFPNVAGHQGWSWPLVQ